MFTQQQLTDQANQIKNETQPNANTALRLGTMLVNIISTMFSIFGKVKTVNGAQPDVNGNVEVSVSDGYTDDEAIAAAKTNIGTGADQFAAGNHSHEGMLTTDSDVSGQVKYKTAFRFDEVTVDPSDEIMFDNKVNISAVSTSNNLTIQSFQVKADGASTWVNQASFANVNTWISSNISVGQRYWIKVNQAPAAGTAGSGQVIVTYNRVA